MIKKYLIFILIGLVVTGADPLLFKRSAAAITDTSKDDGKKKATEPKAQDTQPEPPPPTQTELTEQWEAIVINRIRAAISDQTTLPNQPILDIVTPGLAHLTNRHSQSQAHQLTANLSDNIPYRILYNPSTRNRNFDEHWYLGRLRGWLRHNF